MIPFKQFTIRVSVQSEPAVPRTVRVWLLDTPRPRKSTVWARVEKPPRGKVTK
jgi:hypothetical protein